MNPGRYHMSQKELQRLPVIEAVIAKQTTQIEAAACLGLSTRQVRRLERRVQAEGPSGLIHRSCEQPAHPLETSARRSRPDASNDLRIIFPLRRVVPSRQRRLNLQHKPLRFLQDPLGVLVG